MFILGLTGSIGMGKTVAAQAFRREGLPVHDSDAAVHALMSKGGDAVGDIEAVFPGVVKHGAVDRTELGRRVFGDDDALKRLEAMRDAAARLVNRNRLGRDVMARGMPEVVVLEKQTTYQASLYDLLTAYAVRLSHIALAQALGDRLEHLGGRIEMGEMAIPEQKSGRMLPTAICARWQA